MGVASSAVPPKLYQGPQTLSIQPTFQCNAQCTDCGTLSSPYDKTTLSLETIFSAIDQAKALDFANVVFTGGEATIRWEMLLKGIRYAHSREFPTRLVTNAYWARTPSMANARIASLIEAGLDEINFSTGDEHVRFVPMERVVNAIIAAVSLGLSTNVMVELRSERKVSKDTITDDPRIRNLSVEQQGLLGFTESPWMPVDPGRVERYAEGSAANRNNLADRLGCDSILQTYVVQADQRIGACCGLGLRIIPELNIDRAVGNGFLATAIAEAEADFLKLWIHTYGPEKILAWASEKDLSIEWEDMYAHRCQACLRLYQDPVVREVIREHYQEMLAQVLQAHWLDTEYVPGRLANSVPLNSDDKTTSSPKTVEPVKNHAPPSY
jgi:organic radical activating enzyme